MPSPFYKVSAAVGWNGGRTVFWLMDGRSNPGTAVDFYVDRARSAGEWSNIAGPLRDICFYEDLEQTDWSKDMDTFYQIRFLSGGSWVRSVPVQAGNGWTERDFRLAKEIVRKEMLVACRHGLAGSLLKRKTWGTPCPVCRDFDTREPVDDHCTTCFGTGITGGYYPPIDLPVQPVSTRKQSKAESQAGLIQPVRRTVRAVMYPFVDVNDIWASSGTGSRYIIKNQIDIAAEWAEIPLVGLLPLELLARTSVVHSEGVNEILEDSPRPAGFDWNAGNF